MSEPLTRRAHRLAAEALRAGGRAIDATAGNGHDTAFLADQVGGAGLVLAIDRQRAAISAARRRVAANGLGERVALACADHADLLGLTPAAWRGSVDCVMFNLGYLPGSDRSLITHPASTRAGLDAARYLLRPRGVLTVIAYRGHPGGAEEAGTVQAWMADAAAEGDGWTWHAPPSQRGPVLHALRRGGGPVRSAAMPSPAGGELEHSET